MKTLKHAFLALFLFSTSAIFAQSQTEMNQEAMESYEKTDQELNKVYQAILKQYKEDAIFIKNLRASQRLWIQFRDAELSAKYPERGQGHYGSMQPMCHYGYLQKMTEERIKTLNQWLSTEEGDGC